MTENIADASYVSSEKLRDGREIAIRAIRSDDKPLLQEAWHHLSKESQYFRFFSIKDELSDKELAYFTDIDFFQHVGLLVSLVESDSEVPAGVGRFIMTDSESTRQTAELALTVLEEFQGQGIGTILLKHLIKIAQAEGIKELTGFVLPENTKMLAIFSHCGLPMRQLVNSAGIVEISLSLV